METDPINAPGLPEEFLRRLEEIVPCDHLDAVMRSFERARPPVFRLNSLRTEEQALLDVLAGLEFSVTRLKTPFPAFCVPVDQRQRLTRSPPTVDGRLYIQGLASILTTVALAPRPGEEVLDLAAAPGGKTLHMACMMGNRGRIAAVESVRARFFRLRANLVNHGASMVDTYLRDGTGVWRHCPERFNRVLLDAPCSSEARFQVNDSASSSHWKPRKIKEMSRKQRRLLFSAIQSTKPGGTLVYSTCTFAPEENELVIDRALRRFGDALTVEALRPDWASWQTGLTVWRGAALDPSIAGALRLLPDDLQQAAFICRIRKTRSTLT